jgi:hypothetical protein
MTLTGCGSNKIYYIPPITYTENESGEWIPTDLIQLGEDIEVKVWVLNSNGEKVLGDNKVFISQGWLMVPPPPQKVPNDH